MTELLHDAESARRLDITPQQLRLIIKRSSDFPPIESHHKVKLRQGNHHRLTLLPVRDFEKVKAWMEANKVALDQYKPNRPKKQASTLANPLMHSFLIGNTRTVR
jgi:hypothetical protein